MNRIGIENLRHRHLALGIEPQLPKITRGRDQYRVGARRHPPRSKNEAAEIGRVERVNEAIRCPQRDGR